MQVDTYHIASCPHCGTQVWGDADEFRPEDVESILQSAGWSDAGGENMCPSCQQTPDDWINVVKTARLIVVRNGESI